jgi:uncharacterized protein
VTKWISAWLGASVVCLGTACGSSPPLRYYTLSRVEPETRAELATQPARVRLDRVTIPGELDRPEIVRRVDPNRLQIQELDRWAAPLDEMIRRVLSADLAARLPHDVVVDPNGPAAGDQRLLTVDIQEFYGDAGCAVTLRAAWALKPPQGEATRAADEVHIPSTGGCPEALPATMSLALAQLSERIARATATGAIAK